MYMFTDIYERSTGCTPGGTPSRMLDTPEALRWFTGMFCDGEPPATCNIRQFLGMTATMVQCKTVILAYMIQSTAVICAHIQDSHLGTNKTVKCWNLYDGRFPRRSAG